VIAHAHLSDAFPDVARVEVLSNYLPMAVLSVSRIA
jgi:hypothetical protein